MSAPETLQEAVAQGQAQPEILPLFEVRTVTAANFASWITSGVPFALSRWGNGEWHSVFGRNRGRTAGGQDYNAELGEELRIVLRGRPFYMMELKRWEKVFHGEVDQWLVAEGLDTLNWIAPDALHKASIKGRLAPVLQAIRQAPGFVAVGPPHLSSAQQTLGFSKLIAVPSANAFAARKSIAKKVLKVAKELPDGSVVTFSAGMTANLLVDDVHRGTDSRLILLDVGSLWDPYAGVLSRSYMRSENFQLSL